jgi:hypothetical protein
VVFLFRIVRSTFTSNGETMQYGSINRHVSVSHWKSNALHWHRIGKWWKLMPPNYGASHNIASPMQYWCTVSKNPMQAMW